MKKIRQNLRPARPLSAAEEEHFCKLEARKRLLGAAEELFAERGFASVSVRELAERARVNIAAVNYYFGGKENLYLETVRHSFRNTRRALPKLEALLEAAQAEGTEEAARHAIELYINEIMHIIFISRETTYHAGLMGHELSNPTQALDAVVDEFISPVFKVLLSLVEQCRPDLAAAREANLAALSIIGQCLNYSLALPLTLKLLKRPHLTAPLVKKLAKQIAEFSLQALAKA
jgi:AcrR family transcriptional regulator